jgi:hypothetical protein
MSINLAQGPFGDGPFQAPIDFTSVGKLGIYAVETVQRCAVGARYMTADGRVYRYGKATTGGVDAYHGCMSLADDVLAEVLDVDSPSAAAAIGTIETYITETGFTEDELQGAYIFVYATTGGQFRRVTHNDVYLTSKTRIEVDAPWDQTIAGTEYTEMFENPWSLCTKTATGKACVIAIPACSADSGDYFWGQTWGPCVVSPGETIAPSGDIRQCVFGSNGALFLETTHSDYQTAGFVLNYNSDDGPLLMLQISV